MHGVKKYKAENKDKKLKNNDKDDGDSVTRHLNNKETKRSFVGRYSFGQLYLLHFQEFDVLIFGPRL